MMIARKNGLRMTTAVAAMIAAGGGAQAQSFYAGLGYEYGRSLHSETCCYDPGTVQVTSALAGARFGGGTGMFWGVEAETSLSASLQTGDSQYIDAVRRLRGLVGRNLSGFDVFATFGVVQVDGDLDDGFTTNSGTTFGVGAEYPLGDQFDLRIEFIHDDVTTVPDNYRWQNNALRVGAIVKF